MIFTTTHGAEKLRKRLGVPKEDTTKAATEVLERGLPRDKAQGQLRRYLDLKYFSHDKSARIFVWRNQIHIFAKEVDGEITCFPLPGRLLQSAVNQIERWTLSKTKPPA